ncbi:MAG: hypothetical protein KDB22_27005 [Planctomycetales bacterium]|nr:hypothetical protein [Planctomycetales bacterium]
MKRIVCIGLMGFVNPLFAAEIVSCVASEPYTTKNGGAESFTLSMTEDPSEIASQMARTFGFKPNQMFETCTSSSKDSSGKIKMQFVGYRQLKNGMLAQYSASHYYTGQEWQFYAITSVYLAKLTDVEPAREETRKIGKNMGAPNDGCRSSALEEGGGISAIRDGNNNMLQPEEVGVIRGGLTYVCR